MLKHWAISPQNMCQRSSIMRDIVLFGQNWYVCEICRIMWSTSFLWPIPLKSQSATSKAVYKSACKPDDKKCESQYACSAQHRPKIKNMRWYMIYICNTPLYLWTIPPSPCDGWAKGLWFPSIRSVYAYKAIDGGKWMKKNVKNISHINSQHYPRKEI